MLLAPGECIHYALSSQALMFAYRYAPHPSGYGAAVSSSEDYAMRARAELDMEEPSVDALQTLVLLAIAYQAAGKGKKAYMLLGWSFQAMILRTEETNHS